MSHVQRLVDTSGMRVLSAAEVDCVSGGLPPIVVRGTPYRADVLTNGGGFVGYADATTGSSDHPTLNPETGGGGGEAESIDAPKDTPCVEAAPEGVDIVAINTAALVGSNQIKALNDANWEYSIVIYEIGGVVGWTAPFTQQLPDQVDYDFSGVPDGARIIGLLHNQPDQMNVTDGYPSPADWQGYNRMTNPDVWGNPRGITVDSNMLMYVFTNEDNKTRVYDKTDKQQTSNSCSLQ